MATEDILQDEIRVSHGLVYDKHSGELVGFTNLEETANDLCSLQENMQGGKKQKKLATSMLVIMVRGTTSTLRYPLACFPTTGVTSEFLYPIIWQAVKILEYRCKLKVLFITCDGASANRRFFKLNKTADQECTYWCWNKYSFDKRKIFFVCDVPHLLKTTRNCFANSFYHKKTRMLWKNGRFISWRHVLNLYEDHVEGQVLSGPYKLKWSHVDLTAFSQMKVNLAAQVLSKTVADSLEQNYGPDVKETVTFIRHMNRYYDCLNVRNLKESAQKRNPDLREYRTLDDERLQYLTGGFLEYLQEWEDGVTNRDGFAKAEKGRMLLSHQTLSGLRISARSIVEIVQFLLREGASFVLTHNFNQDPLEEHFAHCRQKGGANNNPTVWDVQHCSSKLRVLGSSALAPIRGNITNRKRTMQADNTSLAKRAKKS
ncbi:uncharacterized protein [Littorina saxatilis]|uniref:uncharacterized protein n=1 Tax=Littorina saxatilis TaxID=31220 RepID=UPI0038B4D0EA